MPKVAKREATASAGREAVVDSEKSHHCNHCFRVGGPAQFKRCKQCKSVLYCSMECQKAQWQEHKLLCQAISQLSNTESREFKDPACVGHLTPTEHAKVIDLIGKKYMVKCLLNDCEVDMLWDTGAQVSIIPVKSLQEHLGSIAIRPLSELLETSLNLTAVNGIQIPYIGWVEVRLKLTPSSSNSTQVELVAPFLVTSDNLDCPILGYNAIEELVRNDQNPITTVYESFPGKDKAKLDALVNFIQSTSSDHICIIKTGRKDVVIPKNHTVNVDCRANTGPVEKLTPVLFVPETLAEWPDGVEVTETLLNIKPGKTSRVKVAVYNETDHDIVLKNRTMLGCLQAVKSVTAADVRLTDKEGQGNNEQPEEEQFHESPIPQQQSEGGLNPLPAVDLSGLNQCQRTVAEAMLRGEYESCIQ